MIDFIGQGGDGIQGDVAQKMMVNRLNPGMMRPYIDEKTGKTCVTVYTGGDPKKPESYQTREVQVNATLRRDEWKQLDDAVLGVSRTRLTGINDLESAGLVYNLTNPMGTTSLEYHDLGDAFTAELSMDGVTRAKNDRPAYSSKYLPIPIVHVDYELNARELEASRRLGNPLDTTSAELAARKVAEKLENLLFTDTTMSFGNGVIYSYLNHPNLNPVTLVKQWKASSNQASAAEILADVMAMKAKSIAAKHYGPWVLYVPTNYETRLDEDYDTVTPGTTIRERLMKIAGITAIKTADHMTNHKVVLVQMTSDVVRLVKGMAIQSVQWQNNGPFSTNFKVLTIQVPQIRADQAGNSGITLLA